MRRSRALLLGGAIALLGASPAAAAEVEVKGLDTLTWDKPQVQITAGDTVRWTFAGTTQAHNVRSNTDNWSFRSDIGLPAPDASNAFATPGTYGFYCEVHPSTMTGTVTVGAVDQPPLPPPPPPLLSEQAYGNDSGAPTEYERGGVDATRPTVRSISVRRVRGGADVRFRVSERSQATVAFKRGSRVVATRRTTGSGARLVRVRGLRAGRYQVRIRATDIAGNASRLSTKRVALR